MTREERAARLRPAVEREVEATNLRAVAARAKVAHGTLAALIKGSVPQPRVLNRLEEWVEEEGVVLDGAREPVQDTAPPPPVRGTVQPPSVPVATVGAEGSEVVLRQFEEILRMDLPLAERLELLRLHVVTVRAANLRGEIVAAERRAYAAILEAQLSDVRLATLPVTGATPEELAALAARGHAARVGAGPEGGPQREAV